MRLKLFYCARESQRPGNRKADAPGYAFRKDSPTSETPSEAVDDVVFPLKLPAIKKVNDLLIKEALKRASGIQSIALRMLGITDQALSKRLKSNRE